MSSASHQLFGGADDWRLVSSPAAGVRDNLLHLCVCNVFSIPGQQIVHSVNCSNRDVRCIFRGSGWDDASRQEPFGDLERCFVDLEERDFGKKIQSFPSHYLISRRGFLNHHLRGVEIKRSALLCPPFIRQLLMSGDNQITARPGCQVADDGRLDINPVAQVDPLARASV
jgi:hypothetical protein